MRILYISNADSRFGSAHSLQDLVSRISSMGHKVYVLLPDHSDAVRELQKKRVTPIVIPFQCCAYSTEAGNKNGMVKYVTCNIKAVIQLVGYIKKYKIQLIHSNNSNVDIGAVTARICGIPHIFHVRELLYKDYKLAYYFPKTMDYFFKHSQKVIFISPFVKETRKYHYENAVTIFNGINIDYYMDHMDKAFSANEIRLLYAGVIRKEKGLIDAVRVVDRLVNLLHYNVKLKIAGDNTDYLKQIMKYVERKDLHAYIEYVGYQKNLKPLRKWADIALICSRNEGLGRVTIESMLSNTLVIGAAAGCTKDLIKDEENGYLYPVGDIEKMADKITQAYQDKDKTEMILKKAMQYAVSNFDSDAYAIKISDLYTDVLEDKRYGNP